MISVPAYYDGANIKPLEAINIKQNQKIILTIMDEYVDVEVEVHPTVISKSMQAFKAPKKYRKHDIEEFKNRDSIFDAFAGGLIYIADDFDETPDCFEEYL